MGVSLLASASGVYLERGAWSSARWYVSRGSADVPLHWIEGA